MGLAKAGIEECPFAIRKKVKRYVFDYISQKKERKKRLSYQTNELFKGGSSMTTKLILTIISFFFFAL